MATQVSTSQRTMKDLLANVSHELKTPLTSIQGLLAGDAGRRGQHAGGRRKSPAGSIHDEANRMRALVDDLLLLSQIDSGQVPMQYEHVDLTALLQRTIERFQWSFRDAGIDGPVADGRVPTVQGDDRRLEQVFRTCMRERGPPHAARRHDHSKRLHGASDGHVRVGVHNTGSVIPQTICRASSSASSRSTGRAPARVAAAVSGCR